MKYDEGSEVLAKLGKLVLFLLAVSMVLAAMFTDVKTTSPKARISEFSVFRASWYGSRFHGRKTANGETFNMYAISAAHKDLPFGTKVLLINPENGEQIRVVINDRGPYVYGRDIDVSLAVAEALGFKRDGVTDLIAIVQPDSSNRSE